MGTIRHVFLYVFSCVCMLCFRFAFSCVVMYFSCALFVYAFVVSCYVFRVLLCAFVCVMCLRLFLCLLVVIHDPRTIVLL